MIDEKLRDELLQIKITFPDAFISLNCELILQPELNIYFLLDNITDIRQVRLKMLAWVTRHCFTGVSTQQRELMIRKLNDYLGTEFSEDEFERIYLAFNDIRNGNKKFEARHYLFAFGGYNFSYLDL